MIDKNLQEAKIKELASRIKLTRDNLNALANIPQGELTRSERQNINHVLDSLNETIHLLDDLKKEEQAWTL